jgi:Elongation factor Tu GTP binding domain
MCIVSVSLKFSSSFPSLSLSLSLQIPCCCLALSLTLPTTHASLLLSTSYTTHIFYYHPHYHPPLIFYPARPQCTSIQYQGHQVNILDTPGHGDFGGEVERILNMVDGVVLIVDASEGVGTQTKFVLSKALNKHLRPLVVLNKMDRPTRDVDRVEGEVFDLFCALDADGDQMDYTTLYASAREGWASSAPDRVSEDMIPLLDAILANLPAPAVDIHSPFRMLVTLVC